MVEKKIVELDPQHKMNYPSSIIHPPFIIFHPSFIIIHLFSPGSLFLISNLSFKMENTPQ